MNTQLYFGAVNYTGNHLHVDNYKDEYTPYVEAIAWERQDDSMDLFFEDFVTDRDRQELFVNNGYHCETFKGGYIGNVKTDEEAYAMFQKWVDEVLYPYQNKDKTSSEGIE